MGRGRNLEPTVNRPLMFLAALVALAAVLFLVREIGPEPKLSAVRVDSVAELERVFDRHGYHWPPGDPVPRLAVKRLPPHMGRLRTERKKALFFRSLLPLILAENRRIRDQREFLLQALPRLETLSGTERRRMAALGHEYDVPGDPAEPEVSKQLLLRVDIVPAALALAQAANESAWGAARFTREGNNLFGVWTWEEGKGMVPKRREAGRTHMVRSYPDLRASVRAYLHTLNVGHAYRLFREKRRAMRLNGQKPDALKLVGLLDRYSERGQAYVAEIRRMILGNQLNRVGSLRLAE